MKKTLLTIAIVLGLGLTSFADPYGGGLFQRGAEREENNIWFREGGMPIMPTEHGLSGNQNAPVGSGIVLLTALGAAYLVGKKRREE